jgi:hypothetical protein
MPADDDQSQMIWYLVIFVLFVILLITYQIHRNRFDIVGLTIDEAREKTLTGDKKWGDKIGFVEPPRGQFQLLGRIAEQTIEKRGKDTFVHYKLYQINTDKIDEMMRPSPDQLMRQEEARREKERKTQEENRQREEERMLNESRRREEEQRQREESARQQESERQQEEYQRKIEDARRRVEPPQPQKPRRNILGLLEEEKPTRANFHMQKSNFFW